MADPDCASPTQEFETAPIRFQRPVLGTNGNRKNAYYIGSEREISQATSPPTVIPANLEFLSWHLDEGAAFDLKAVQVSTDGVSYTTIAICTMGGGSPFPFCDFITQRDANDWDAISLPVPPQFVGQLGRVRFLYDTSDGCCQFERGWFVDALNFATDCACSASTECAYLTTGCASGVCDTQECVSQPANVGASCTLLGGSADCGGGACSDNGFCAPITTNDTSDCGDCTEGPGLCTYCSLGACPNCPAVQRFFNFSFGPQWTLSGDWGFFDSCLPPNQVTPNEFLCVNFPQDPTTPLAPGWLYNNGSRTFANPWTFAAREIEVGSARLGPAVIPAMLTFNSWHQDRGGNNTFMPRDTKVIRGSLDGVNWTTIVNCDGNMTIPFCLPWPTPGMNRPITSFDAVSIPVPQNLAGQTGFIEITYDTVDQGQGWERGWIIDDINFARCD